MDVVYEFTVRRNTYRTIRTKIYFSIDIDFRDKRFDEFDEFDNFMYLKKSVIWFKSLK